MPMKVMRLKLYWIEPRFYAEGGGQLADGGLIRAHDGSLIEIDDVQAPIPGVFVHRGRVARGSWESGVAVHAEIDLERRRGISRAHTATQHGS